MATKYKYNDTRKEWYTLVYDGTLTPTGEKHRKRITSKKSSKDLENKVADFRRSLEVVEDISNISLGEYANKWLDLYKANKEANTKYMYRSMLTKLEPIAEKRLTDIKRSDIQFIINLNKDHPRTCKIILQGVKQILKSAMIDGYISEKAFLNASSNISIPTYVKPEKTPLNASERDVIKSVDLPEREKVFLSLLYYCGLRKSEALALQDSDIDLNKNVVTINKTIVILSNIPSLKPYPKSANGVRSVPLCAPCIDVLRPYLANCKGALFKGLNNAYLSGSEYATLWRRITKAVNTSAGYDMKLTAHRLRHNFCTLLCYRVPMISTKTIAKLLGDNEDMVLRVYSHIMEEKEDVIGALNSAFDL